MRSFLLLPNHVDHVPRFVRAVEDEPHPERVGPPPSAVLRCAGDLCKLVVRPVERASVDFSRGFSFHFFPRSRPLNGVDGAPGHRDVLLEVEPHLG